MNNQEIIANLWYIINDLGFITEVRGRMYISDGSDEDKLKFLHQFTHTDFMISETYLLPENLKTTINDEAFNIIHYTDMKLLGGEGILFKDLFEEMEDSLPLKSILKFPKEPLTVVTPLSKDKNGILLPNYNEKR